MNHNNNMKELGLKYTKKNQLKASIIVSTDRLWLSSYKESEKNHGISKINVKVKKRKRGKAMEFFN